MIANKVFSSLKRKFFRGSKRWVKKIKIGGLKEFRKDGKGNSSDNAFGYDVVKYFFDEKYYLERYEDVKASDIDPLEHYLNYGWKEGRDPSPFFNTNFYLSRHRDVARANINPLFHYALWGKSENRAIASVVLSSGGSTMSEGVYSDNYREQFSVAAGGKSYLYAPLMQCNTPAFETLPTYIAFYLPQFHPFPENDEWWGKGFTEWTNVSKAIPQFRGHYQPRLPGELGFYDLRVEEVMARQIHLAKKYGVGGFCFHYYWFGGKRLMEKPLERFLTSESSELDFPFCLCWANENWTRRWDGAESDVLISQNHSKEDNKEVFYDLLRYMKDPRYIKVDGKPILVVYRPAIIPDIKEVVSLWRELAENEGLKGIHLVASNAFGFEDSASLGFDAIVEFPPHGVVTHQINSELEFLNSEFRGNVYDYSSTIESCCDKLKSVEEGGLSHRYYPSVMTGWDNEARKPGAGNVFHDADPLKFFQWLEFATSWSDRNHDSDSKFVFINAWNEWAEGTYLEPDRRFGYGYLTAVSQVRQSQAAIASSQKLYTFADEVLGEKRADAVVCVHIFYEDMIDSFHQRLKPLQQAGLADVAISVPDSWSIESLKLVVSLLRPVKVIVSRNRGRDVWPFIQLLRSLADFGYKYGCKVHSKKSFHLQGGREWGIQLLDSLLRKECAAYAIEKLRISGRVGIVAPSEAYQVMRPDALYHNKDGILKVFRSLGFEDGSVEGFIAGTMFWFSFDMVSRIAESSISDSDFEPEVGAIDGTFAHAFERVIVEFCKKIGFDLSLFEAPELKTPY